MSARNHLTKSMAKSSSSRQLTTSTDTEGRIVEEAVRRRLRQNDPILEYFNEMRRSMQPKNPEDWQQMAVAIEEVQNKPTIVKSDPKQQQLVKETDDQRKVIQKKNKSKKTGNNGKSDNKKPSTPCPRCLRYGYTEFHWKSQCLRTTDPYIGGAGLMNPHSSNYIFYDMLVDGQPVRALFGSGSNISAISVKMAKRLELEPQPRLSQRIQHLFGQIISHGIVRPMLSLDGRSKRWPIHVLQDYPHDMLLGYDVFQYFNSDDSGRCEPEAWVMSIWTADNFDN